MITGGDDATRSRARALAGHPVVSGAVARVASMLPIALATFGISRLVIEQYGLDTFNAYALLVSTVMLLPLNNLGTGAAVTRAFALHDPRSEEAERVMLTASRTLAVSTVVVIVASLGLGGADLWPSLLGPAAEPGFAFGIGIALYAIGFVPGLGQSILLGVNRNHLTIIVQAFWLPSTLALIGLAALLDADPATVIVAPALTLMANTIVNAWLGGRVTGFRWRRLASQLTSVRSRPGARIRAMAGPALILNLSIPLAVQSDRVVLSHFSDAGELANYSIVFQIFAPLLALLGAAAQPLWPMITRAHADGTEPPSLIRIVSLFSALAVAASGCLVLVADPVGRIVGGDEIGLGLALPAAMGLVVLLAASAYPLGMAMMDPVGVRFAAMCCAVALPVNVVVSILLTGPLGASGPLLSTAIVGFLAQTVPSAMYLRRRAGSSIPDAGDGVTVASPGPGA